MDTFAITPKGLSGLPAADKGEAPASALRGAAASFVELMKASVARFEGDFQALTSGTLVGSAGERVEPAADDRAPAGGRQDDYGQDRHEDRGYSAEAADDRFDAGRPDRADDRGGEPLSARGDEPSDAGSEEGGVVQAERPGSATENGDAESADAQDAPGGETRSPTTATNDEAAGENSGTTQGPTATGSEDNPTGADGISGQTLLAQQNAEQILASLVALFRSAELPAQAADSAQENTEAGQRGNALRGLATALANVGNAPAAQASGADGSGPQTHGQPAAAASTIAQNQAQAKAELAATVANGTAPQAAALSTLVGEGNRLAIRVNVTGEATTLASQSTSNLASATVLAADVGTLAANGQPSSAGNGPASPTTAANLAAQPVAGIAPGQPQETAGPAVQVQSMAASASEAKGPAQAGVHGNPTAQQIQAGTGETAVTAAPGAANAAIGIQPKVGSPTAQAQRPTAHGNEVFDQVSVQISKALADGIDKISIQLNPPSLGRIDVKLEMGADGRLTAMITADNRNTLDLLEGDAKSLEEAFLEAGLQTDSGSLSFGLRGEQREAAEAEFAGSGNPWNEPPLAEAAAEEEELTALLAGDPYEGGIRPDGRIDIRA